VGFLLLNHTGEIDMRASSIGLIVAALLGLFLGKPLYSAEPTKATFLVTGLHCPPCTSTVQGSLSRIKGVKSVSVNWNTKNAKVEFDESVLPAQSLAAAVEATPHMMGAGMRYGGWLALKVPSISDQASGQKVKDVLSKVEGVKTVAIYPAQQSAGVLFAGTGTLTSRHLIEALGKEGFEATSF
jgi:copper chaperone CopZ